MVCGIILALLFIDVRLSFDLILSRNLVEVLLTPEVVLFIEFGYDMVPNKNGNDKSFLNDRILALFTEVGEFANETESFKYWKENKKDNREKQLEEYLDILFFYLSIGNTMRFTSEEVEQAYKKKWKENFKRQEEGY